MFTFKIYHPFTYPYPLQCVASAVHNYLMVYLSELNKLFIKVHPLFTHFNGFEIIDLKSIFQPTVEINDIELQIKTKRITKP